MARFVLVLRWILQCVGILLGGLTDCEELVGVSHRRFGDGFSSAEHLKKLVRSLYTRSFSYNNKRCPKIGMSIFRMILIIDQPYS